MAKQFGDYHSTSDLLNAVANSALSTIEVSIISAAMISVDILPGETIGVSCTDALGVSSLGLSVGIAETIGVSATDLDVSISDTIGVSAGGSLPVCGMTLPDFTGVSAATTMSAGLQPYTVINAGMTSAVAASTAYQLPTVECKSVAVKADDDNTNITYIGASAVAGDGANGYRLEAGQSISLRLDNVNRVYFCTDTAAEKIYYIVIN